MGSEQCASLPGRASRLGATEALSSGGPGLRWLCREGLGEPAQTPPCPGPPAHLTSTYRVPGSKWRFTPSWVSFERPRFVTLDSGVQRPGFKSQLRNSGENLGLSIPTFQCLRMAPSRAGEKTRQEKAVRRADVVSAPTWRCSRCAPEFPGIILTSTPGHRCCDYHPVTDKETEAPRASVTCLSHTKASPQRTMLMTSDTAVPVSQRLSGLPTVMQ